ncbi:adenylate/guanylate cyclase domain-containing protein [Candidatus Haliotispira prima]|uniref:Adenylate/guanylate cyclase domain-containing protein n=1 Tax=Candidatus Haliotispira prima TaxID=3034016 RepID=A0ABY8MJF0_9SPIO|nr:adenylate/guanylate cyclase domain-containing protein [Candidatus Haliotispira prima]
MKHVNIPIGFKLITITSFILLISLVGTNYAAGVFFERDTIARIQEVTADKSKLLSLKVQADTGYMISRVRAMANSLLNDFEADGADNGQEGQNGKLYRTETLADSKHILYVAVYGGGNGSSWLLKDELNTENGEGITDPELLRDIGRQGNFLAETPVAPFLYNVRALSGVPAVALLFPLTRNANGTDVGGTYFVLAYLSEEVFTEAINTVSEYETYIVNHDGDLLAHRNVELLKTNVSFRTDGIVGALLESPINNGQMRYKDQKGMDRIGSFFKIDLGSIGVVSTTDRDKILQAVYQIRFRNYCITGIVLFLSVMIIYLFAKTLSSPIKKLVVAARKIEKGEFLLNIKASSHDEIGQLTRSFTQMGKGLNERDRMKDALGKFVNEEVANLALEGALQLGGERKEAAVFFSDIRSFTAISEKLTPEEVVEFLNEYMTAMVSCVEATHGIVDKFIGDAVMAVWGAPISHGNDTESAIDSALMMRFALEHFNQGRGGDKNPIIKIGCGINTGPLISGQIGSEDRMEYTVIGDAVNLASRIEGLTKPFGADILISADSRALVKGIYHLAKMPPIMVKGKVDPVNIYAVLGRCDDPKAFQSLDQLRKYLGTENVDLSQFDGEGKEEKFGAVPANVQKTTTEKAEEAPSNLETPNVTLPPTAKADQAEFEQAGFIHDAKLVSPNPVENGDRAHIANELLMLREAVAKKEVAPTYAAQRLREIKKSDIGHYSNDSAEERQKIEKERYHKLLALKTALELGQIPAEEVASELSQLKQKVLES